MTCDEVRDLIQLYMDDALDGRDTLNLQKHLEACSGCSRLLESYLEQDRLLKEQTRAQHVDSNLLRESILNAIVNQSRQSQMRWRLFVAPSSLLVWKRIAAVIVLAIVAGILLLRSGLFQYTSQNVYAAVAEDHADHCAIDSGVGAITDRDELDRLSAAYGRLNRTPDLSVFRYSHPAGRTCKVYGTVFLHLVYYSPDDPPLSVFLRPHSSDLTTDRLAVVREKAYAITSVSKSGVDVLIVNSPDFQQGMAIAEAIVSHL